MWPRFDQPRKASINRVRVGLRSVQTSFNVAAVRSAAKNDPLVPVAELPVPAMRFNVAAVRQPRKGYWFFTYDANGRANLLQCGRGRVSRGKAGWNSARVVTDPTGQLQCGRG